MPEEKQRALDVIYGYVNRPRQWYERDPSDAEELHLRRLYGLSPSRSTATTTTTTDKGGSAKSIEPPVFSCNPPPDKPPWRQTAYDVAAQRESERPPDSWRRGDEPFMVTVGEEPDDEDEDEVGAEETTTTPNEPGEQQPKQRKWLSADEFVSQVNRLDIIKLLDGGKHPTIDQPHCVVCGEIIRPEQGMIWNDQQGYKRHSGCLPFQIEERLLDARKKKD